MAKARTRPLSDRSLLQQIVAGLSEGVILVNTDQTIAWCNEAALAMHGVSTIEELGRDVAAYRERFQLRYRNQHVLPPGQYPMERIIAGEAFSEVVVEVTGPTEDQRRIQQIRSLVLTAPDGAPDALVLILENETERFDAEERFQRTFNANPAPAIIVRLADGRYVKVNQGFLELTGFTAEALIGRSIHEYDVLAKASRRELAVERLHLGATIPQMEAELPVSGGGTKTVILAGQPIEIGDASCLLFTFADLQPRKQAEDALRQSEERFAAAFRLAPGPMAIIAIDGLRLLDVNDAFTAATGWQREEVIGRSESELGLWGEGEARERLERQILETGHVRSVEVRVTTKENGASDYLLSAESVLINGERCVLSVMLDIGERKQTETALLNAVEAVMQDTSWFGQKIVEKLATLTGRDPVAAVGPAVADLSPRAREILGLLAKGSSDEEIARTLGIARNTVRNQVSAIYRATGMRGRSALVVWARQRGLGLRDKAPAPPRRPRRRADRDSDHGGT